VAADAEWCGQCFASLRQAEPAPEPVAEPAAVAEAGGPGATGAATWPCPVCQARNAIELDSCATCGTPFAVAMRRGSDVGVTGVDPKEAVVRSLIFPGLGHSLAGRGGEGLARGALFVVTSAMLALFLSAGVPSGPAATVVALYAVAALVLYFGTALEAYRIARGGPPFVTGRALVWALSGLILVTVVLLALVVTQAPSG
jgi:hypothetical protein